MIKITQFALLCGIYAGITACSPVTLPITNHYHCCDCGVDMGNYEGQLCRYSWCDGIIVC